MSDLLLLTTIMGTVFFFCDIGYFQPHLQRCGWKVCMFHFFHHIFTAFCLVGWAFVSLKIYIPIVIGMYVGWALFDGCFWTHYCERLCGLPKNSLRVDNPVNILREKLKKIILRKPSS